MTRAPPNPWRRSDGLISTDDGLNHGEVAPHVLHPGGAMFKSGIRDISRSLGSAETRICVEGIWILMGPSIFSDLVPNLLSCPGFSALGAAIDTSR